MIDEVKAFVIRCDICGVMWANGEDSYFIDIDRNSLEGWWDASRDPSCDSDFWLADGDAHYCPNHVARCSNEDCWTEYPCVKDACPECGKANERGTQ